MHTEKDTPNIVGGNGPGSVSYSTNQLWQGYQQVSMHHDLASTSLCVSPNRHQFAMRGYVFQK